MSSDTEPAGIITDEQLRTELIKHIETTPVILFMKGTPDQPYCGFSARTAAALDQLNTAYTAVNVLLDPRIREIVSEHSNWPTIPQLFVNGTLVGGCDIVTEMVETGELAELIAGAGNS
jgi:monothiol glutaredoxin